MLLVAGVVLSFLGASAFAYLRLSEMDRELQSLEENAIPSVERLAGARQQLHEVEIRTDELAGTRPGGPTATAARDEIERARAAFDADIAEYRAGPSYPEEREMNREVDRALSSVDLAIERVVAELDAGSPERARTAAFDRLHPAVARTFAALTRLVEYNLSQARFAAERIRRARATFALTTVVLDTAGVLCAGVATFIVASWTRRMSAQEDEQARLERARAAELELFAGRIAHDITSPLASLSYGLEFIKKKSPGDTRALSILDRSLSSVRRINEMVEGLLAFAKAGARPEAGASTEVPPALTAAIAEVRTQADAAGVELVVESAPNVNIACAPGILSSVLVNLVQNAVKYMGDASVRRVAVRARASAGSVRFEVQDTGPGLSLDMQARAFDPFIRGSSIGGGIGLGLATVKRLVEAHDGTVGVTSASGSGSVFWFSLPTTAPSARAGRTARLPGPRGVAADAGPVH